MVIQEGNKTPKSKMLPGFYHKCLCQLLTSRQYTALKIIIILLQSQRIIQIEKLAAFFPLPIKDESRRRHIQRFLLLPQLQIRLLLSSLGLKPNKFFFFYQVQFTKKSGFGKVNLAGYWSQKTKKKQKDEGWYLITNLKTRWITYHLTSLNLTSCS